MSSEKLGGGDLGPLGPPVPTPLFTLYLGFIASLATNYNSSSKSEVQSLKFEVSYGFRMGVCENAIYA